MPSQKSVIEYEVRADQVKPGDYLPGLGRIQTTNDSGGPLTRRRITLYSEGGDWRVIVHPGHPVVVIR